MIRKHPKGVWAKVLITLFIVGFFSAGWILIWVSTLTAPDLTSFDQRKVEQTTKIFDRTGEILLYELNQDVSRTLAPYDEISHHIKNATVAIEDAEFYEHNGIRPIATFRAVFIQPLRGLGVQGGSTITQQVVKNSLLTSKRAISRKINEWALSIKLEQIYSKEEILTALQKRPIVSLEKRPTLYLLQKQPTWQHYHRLQLFTHHTGTTSTDLSLEKTSC